MNEHTNEIPLAREEAAPPKKKIEPPNPAYALLIAAGVFALLGAALCVGAAAGYARVAPKTLDAMYPTISELTLREGRRCEDVGAYGKALELYKHALDGRYEGPQNRAMTLYRLGILQRVHGFGEGLPDCLMEAYAHPQCPVEAYDRVAHALMGEYKPEMDGEMETLFMRWLGAVTNADEYALYYFYRGGYAQLKGDTAQAQTYWARGEGYVSGSPCAYALAESLFAEGKTELARQYNNAYLLGTNDTDFLASAQNLQWRMNSKS
jgi:tetratricopeptide (TPR) repeat protein